MSIGSIIQRHYYQKTTILIPAPLAFIRNNFAVLSTTGISHGDRLNPFSNYYKFDVRRDGNTAWLDGPSGSKLTRLVTKIRLQPSMNEVSDLEHGDATILDLSIQIPLEDINRNLIFMLLVYAYIFYLIPNHLFKLISLFAYWLYLYGLTWLSVSSSIKIIRKYLLCEFLTKN